MVWCVLSESFFVHNIQFCQLFLTLIVLKLCCSMLLDLLLWICRHINELMLLSDRIHIKPEIKIEIHYLKQCALFEIVCRCHLKTFAVIIISFFKTAFTIIFAGVCQMVFLRTYASFWDLKRNLKLHLTIHFYLNHL